ncbi:hypothetical protein GCM10011529_09980 [Polymorphobacter glacialis]|uniref:Uncharacterized protein n=1 Tax=Sandarakinorhabdus glacialis TaxID=1614636 RepID=A0A916ZN63_9SPHN|nr:hypothetical protein [Polymorphobacter glacialis]GGE05597.1 hypothetical protein GCM10011529_09980 [Polymorphobacter glacialis]
MPGQTIATVGAAWRSRSWRHEHYAEKIANAQAGIQRPTLDEELARLCGIYGKTEVLGAAKRAAKAKTGRPREKDIRLMWSHLEADARTWLDGRDPFTLVSNYSIAKACTAIAPGQSEISTHRRLMAKLSKQREDWVLVQAYRLARIEYPYSTYLRTLEALIPRFPADGAIALERDLAKLAIESLHERAGSISPTYTIAEVRRELLAAEMDELSPRPLGLLNYRPALGSDETPPT